MLDNIRSVEPILITDCLNTQNIDSAEQWNKRSAPAFDVLDCDLNYAANLASLSYGLNHNSLRIRSRCYQAFNHPTLSQALSRCRAQAEHPKYQYPFFDPCPSIPAHNVHYQHFRFQIPFET
ncbi:hypothetical protein QC760_009439 [Botrytis cinerea]